MKDFNVIKKEINTRRRTRVKKKLFLNGHKKPRLSVYRSLRGIYAQLIDDSQKRTLVSAGHKEIEQLTRSDDGDKIMTARVSQAFAVGQLLAKKAKEKGITECVFDRGHFRYHGRVKALADGARAGGLKF